MDYLNYGNQVKQVEPKTNETKGEMVEMFPTPAFISQYPFDYSEELNWIKNQPHNRENKNLVNGGSLNRHTDDTFILDKPELSRVRKFIDSQIKQFVVNVMGSDDEMVITQSWVNRNTKGESHHEHKHPNSIVSGVWYPQIYEKSPPIQFTMGDQRDLVLSIKQYTRYNSAKFTIPMRQGELILFSSNLTHSVPPNELDEERISLGFNTWPKGSFGNVESLNHVGCNF